MLKSTLIHPEITAILARAGHHSKVLIADGNYPASTKKGPNAEVICLNLMPGVVSCTQALRAILSAVHIDFVHTMMHEETDPYALKVDPPAWDGYRAVLAELGSSLKLEPIKKWDFYAAVETPDHVLTIMTGDVQPFANILLTLGVRVE